MSVYWSKSAYPQISEKHTTYTNSVYVPVLCITDYEFAIFPIVAYFAVY